MDDRNIHDSWRHTNPLVEVTRSIKPCCSLAICIQFPARKTGLWILLRSARQLHVSGLRMAATDCVLVEGPFAHGGFRASNSA